MNQINTDLRILGIPKRTSVLPKAVVQGRDLKWFLFPFVTTAPSSLKYDLIVPCPGRRGKEEEEGRGAAVGESAAARLPRRPSVKPRSQTSLRRAGAPRTRRLRWPGPPGSCQVRRRSESQTGSTLVWKPTPCASESALEPVSHGSEGGRTRCPQSASLPVGPGPCACARREGRVMLEEQAT